MPGLRLYRTAVDPQWIDYNGHVRDAYYALMLSLATDALMDAIGVDAAYRARTGGTLYSLEMHLHWRQEVRADDLVEVDAWILGHDAKRLHVGFTVNVARHATPAAAGEFVLLHVRQGETTGAAPFAPETVAAIERLVAAQGAEAWPGPASRALSLAKR